MALVPFALTTKARVKTFLGITDASLDTLIDQLINRATDWFEARTNRRFLETDIVELHDGGEKEVFMRQFPVTVFTSVERNIGTEAIPNFQLFNVNDFHVYFDEGYISFFGIHDFNVQGRTQRGKENIRITYKAGFKIDFAFVEDITKHTLPLDIEDFVIRLVARRINLRNAQGVSSESVEGASITWANPTNEQLSFEDKEVIRHYEKKTQHYN